MDPLQLLSFWVDPECNTRSKPTAYATKSWPGRAGGAARGLSMPALRCTAPSTRIAATRPDQAISPCHCYERRMPRRGFPSMASRAPTAGLPSITASRKSGNRRVPRTAAPYAAGRRFQGIWLTGRRRDGSDPVGCTRRPNLPIERAGRASRLGGVRTLGGGVRPPAEGASGMPSDPLVALAE